MKLEATREQRDFCREFLKRGSIANRGKFDGNYYQQLFGLLGQVLISDHLGLERPKNEGFDGGFDIEYNGKKWDVKCVQRKVDPKKHFANNMPGDQIRYQNDGYIFLSYNVESGVYTICGWISKEDFLKKATHYKIGEPRPRDDGTFMKNQTDNYEIRIDQLNNFSSFKKKK